MANVKVQPLPDQKIRVQQTINHLLGAANWLQNRIDETEDECYCSPADLRDDGDGPCNWCEQTIFAWDAVVNAAALLKPMVRCDRAWGIKLTEAAERRGPV